MLILDDSKINKHWFIIKVYKDTIKVITIKAYKEDYD